MSSAASVVSNYEAIIKIACLRRTDSSELKEMLEMLAESTMLYFGGRENLTGENRMLKSTIGPIEKTLYFGDHRNHTMSFFKMHNFISLSPNISDTKKALLKSCLEKLTRYEISFEFNLYHIL